MSKGNNVKAVSVGRITSCVKNKCQEVGVLLLFYSIVVMFDEDSENCLQLR